MEKPICDPNQKMDVLITTSNDGKSVRLSSLDGTTRMFFEDDLKSYLINIQQSPQAFLQQCRFFQLQLYLPYLQLYGFVKKPKSSWPPLFQQQFNLKFEMIDEQGKLYPIDTSMMRPSRGVRYTVLLSDDRTN